MFFLFNRSNCDQTIKCFKAVFNVLASEQIYNKDVWAHCRFVSQGCLGSYVGLYHKDVWAHCRFVSQRCLGSYVGLYPAKQFDPCSSKQCLSITV